MPTWNAAENVNKPCQTDDEDTFLANTTAHNSCSWDTYKVESENKQTAINNAAAAATATANIQAAADAEAAAEVAATNATNEKTAVDTALTDCNTAQTNLNSTDTAAAVTAAEQALTNATASLSTATSEKGKALAAYNSALSEYNADNTNTNLLNAKDTTLAHYNKTVEHETTCTTQKDLIQDVVYSVKACHYVTVGTIKNTEAQTQATEAEDQKVLTQAQEALALTAKTNNVKADAEAAETAAGTTNTASAAAFTAANAAATEVADAESQVQSLLTSSPGHADLTTARNQLTTLNSSSQTFKNNAETSKNESELSFLRINAYKQIIIAKEYETSAANAETATLGHKNDAEGFKTDAETAQSNGDQSAADTAAASANNSATQATTSSLAAGSAASSARALADTVNTNATNNSGDSVLAALNTEINGIATNAETSASNASTYEAAAGTAATAAQTAANPSTPQTFLTQVNDKKTIVQTQKGIAETAETDAAAAGDAATALAEAGKARTAQADAKTAADEADGLVVSAKSTMDTAKSAWDANTSDSALETAYNTAKEDYEAALVSAKEAEVLKLETMAAAITAQVSASTLATNKAAETWDTFSEEAKTYAAACETAATNILTEIDNFKTKTEDYIIALDTTNSATTNTRASALGTASATITTALNKINTAMTSLKALYDTEFANGNATVTAMQSTINTNIDYIFFSVVNGNATVEKCSRSKNNTQAAVDGNSGSDYSATAESAKTDANSNASTASSKLSEVTSHHANNDHASSLTSANEAKTAAFASEVSYMKARSAMRISEAIKTTAEAALSGGTGTQADLDTKTEDYELAVAASIEAQGEYAKAMGEAAKALALADSINATPLNVGWAALALFGEEAAKIGETVAAAGDTMATENQTLALAEFSGSADSSKITKYDSYAGSAANGAAGGATGAAASKECVDLVKTTLDTAESSATASRYTTQQPLVNTSQTNTNTSSTNASTSSTSATNKKSLTTTYLNSLRRRLLEEVKLTNQQSHEDKEQLVERQLNGNCPNNKVCVDNWNEIDTDKYIRTWNYDNNYAGDGGCKFVCESTVNAKPSPSNDQATVGNGVDNCYNSCSTADSLERCVNGQCVKNCQISDPGLTINCNENEECVIGSENTCVPKPCDPVCDTNYETCDSVNNRCILQARKPKIQALTICTAVENCDNKYHLNKCYQCSNYYSFKIDPTNNTSSNPNGVVPALTPNVIPTCINTNIPNALMASEYLDGDVTRYTVEKCAPGYDLDFNNNECVSQIKNCKLNSVDGECLGCDTPYETGSVQLVFGVFEKGYCKTWNEFNTAEQTALTPPYQEHCKYYQYRYTSTNSSQVNSLEDGVSICYECDPDYYFANDGSSSADVCINRRTVNCKTYDSASITGTCIECERGFELLFAGSGNQECREIVNSTKKIPGCSIYDQQLNCLACETGYLFRQTGEGTDQTGYCFIEFVDETCSEQNATVFLNTGAIECFKCAKVKGIYYYPRRYNTPINACLFIGQRKLCLNHDFDTADSLALTNTFQCTLCEADYYLANGVCIRRLNSEIRNCIEYKPDEDSCKTFESTAPVTTSSDEFSTEIESVQILLLNPPDYLSAAQTIDFEGWILSCEIYQDETSCSRCFAPKYINEFGFEYNTKCITATTIIENCVHYTDATTCGECFSGYQLISNECKLVTVENCATYKSENECGSCSAENPYLDGDGNCTVDPRNMFCLTYIISNDAINLQSSKTFECDTCLENYYPDDFSICTRVSTEVHNCKYYAGDGLCKECNEGFYLNFNGKNCFINPPFDPFCKTFSYLTECAVCEKGYYLDNDGLCIACDPEKFPAGCLYCDPNDHTICLICDFGYQMTDQGCTKYVTTESDEPFLRPFNYFIGQTKTESDTKARLSR